MTDELFDAVRELRAAIDAAADDEPALRQLEHLIGQRSDLDELDRSWLVRRLAFHLAKHRASRLPPDPRHQVATLDDRARATLALGGPKPPDTAPTEPLEQVEEGPAATLLFRFEATNGCVWPAGMRDSQFLRPAPTRGRFATGAIIALDDDHCIAVFARVNDDSRARAEVLLRQWADQDDWALTIDTGTTPLPSFGDRTWSGKVCTHCAYRWHVSAIAMPYYSTVAFESTRCPFCRRGRRLPEAAAR